MKENFGKTIKTTATITLIVDMLGSAIAGIALLADGRSRLVPIGLAILFGGLFVSWCIFALFYGFGVLVENSDKTSENSEKIANKDIAVNSIPSAGTAKNTVNTVSSTDDLPEL